jgi:perosamine synthetase
MAERGIACGRYFAPIHLQPAYRSGSWHLPVTEQVADRVIALPFFNALSEPQMDEVCGELRECIAAEE